ncbi:MAG: hypothetical protein PHF81_02765 [Flavobacterium sp.]|nr:hypothetical protein [Flavobacterium sp.]
MQNLKFKRLLILSNSTKSANLFEFSPTLNLITASDNSVGKSTLARLLFWGLGCEPAFDTTWKNLDCKTSIEFSIDKENYKINRYKEIIIFKENDLAPIEYSKITGAFSKKISEILGFKAMLAGRTSGLMEIPPPAFYFLPFFIDQKRSWTKAWDNFDNLGQYDSWKSTIIKYHVGLLSPKHFELEADKATKKDFKKTILSDIVKFETALEIVNTYTPQFTLTTVNENQFEKLTEEIKIDLKDLQENQEKLLNELTQLQIDKVYLEQQCLISQKIVLELDKDYKFSIENIEGDELECPLCGTIHENSIINRTSIMTDKFQANNQFEDLSIALLTANRKIAINDSKLQTARAKINEINSKYTIIEDEQTINFAQIIESIAGNSIKQNVIEDKNLKLIEIDSLLKDIKGIGKEQTGLLTTEEIEEINNSFVLIFESYIKLLGADAVNSSSINSPLDYNKVITEGGAAEGSRAILAYYLSIFSLVEKYGNEVKCALVIDTPNQQEQSEMNYYKIINLLTNNISEETQIILCAMENEHLKEFRDKAKIIILNEKKLLLPELYEQVKKEFNNN